MREHDDKLSLGPAGFPALGDRQVHVWRIPLGVGAGNVARLRSILSPDERQRADRFLKQEIGDRFVIARGSLRRVLGAYLGMAPAELEFTYSGLGKPSLTGVDLNFNLSHSHELAVLAVAQGGELGVDVEYLRPQANFKAIATRFFAPEEVDAIEQLPAEVQLRAFFSCWTRKEAILKAVGKGLTYPLNQVVVSVDPDETPTIIRATDPQAAGLKLFPIDLDDAYISALTAQSRTLEVNIYGV